MLFFGMIIFPSGGIQIEHSTRTLLHRGKILYVGGSGEGNYTRIQDAIDDAVDWDTVFVYDGSSPFYENLIINKTINLIGEDKNTTVIDGNNNDDVIFISSDHVNISGFTIQNSSTSNFSAGIKINSDFNTVYNNNINKIGSNLPNSFGIIIDSSLNNTIKFNNIHFNKYEGIYIFNSDYNHILKNILVNNSHRAILLLESCNNIIENNEIYQNLCGICLLPYSTHNIIKNNKIFNHPCCGIALKKYSNNNLIQYNLITDNLDYGIMLGPGPTLKNTIEMNIISRCSSKSLLSSNAAIILDLAFFNKIKKNNIIDNSQDVMLDSSLFNLWSNNFWDNYIGFGPKILLGWLYLSLETKIIVPWLNFDWSPAKQPFDINL
jgi:parallel beta-helix repeat protein